MQNLFEEIYMPEEFLRLLLGGVGWGLGTLFAGQGDNNNLQKMIHSKNLQECFWNNNLRTNNLEKTICKLNCKKLFGMIISIFFANLLKGFIKKTNAEFALFTLSIFSWC